MAISRSVKKKYSLYNTIDFYGTLRNLKSTYEKKRPKHFLVHTNEYTASLNFFDSNAFLKVYLRVFKQFFIIKK